ncbi:DNA repair protein complementing XP-G cells [Cheilinus undulatus]|uniref:DNA repair protein complementing XP-G cells n=1 Tax=Cheilinus undulatus TaxID=241271 RepID=UPI001BD22734|nr:DNA repair protein complementing XP-G cells [Cheilinus undulatus]
MGVHGLWRLLESTGKPINPETLEGKILAVDISIWLNQAVKGVRDRDGNSVQNAHLLTLFHRICKLLFFRIKPVFVFDGDAPLLKKQTLALRRQRKEELNQESKQTNEKLLKTFLKRQAIKAALGDRSKDPLPSLSSVRRDEVDDMYILPALPEAEEKDKSSSEEEEEEREEWEETADDFHMYQGDLYENPNSVDINSEEFACLPPEMKHEILKEMKEFSKRRRTMYHKPPEQSGDFSQYQLAGLLQRNQLNQRLEGVEKEMSQRSTGSAPQLYNEDGETQSHDVESQRLVSEDYSHYILIKGSKKTEITPQSQPAADPWSGNSLSGYRRQATGRPEPLWRPAGEEEETVQPPTSKDSKPSISKSSQEDTLPPSPRTLKAIQAAMNDSSDEEKAERDKMDGNVSPRTMLAIQQALAEEEDAGAEHETSISSSFTKLQADIHRPLPAPQMVISSSDDEPEPDKVNSLPPEKSEFNGIKTGQSLREKDSLFVSSSEDEIEEVISQRNKALRFAALQQPQEKTGEETKKGQLTEDMRAGSNVQTEMERRQNGNLVQPEAAAASNQSKLFINLSALIHEKPLRAETQIHPVDMKSEASEESESEESFIEVSEEEFKEVDEDESLVMKKEEESPDKANEVEKKTQDKLEEGFMEAQIEPKNAADISEDDEEKKRQMEEEEQKEEIQDKSSSAPTINEWEHFDVGELEAMESSLEVEQSSLRELKQQQERMANTVTGQMYLESQELLRLFGIPFLVAPMEAEAQCAVLDRTDHTNGTITDDSDVWLFGGRHVYKNFFSQNKYVEHYQFSDLQNQLGLDRTKLINLAYLLGSDYTEGVPGVGHVTGMEILNEFPGPGLEPLIQFSKWWSEAQEKKRLVSDPRDTKVKKKLRNLKLQPGFPSPVVAQAYLEPAVDQSESSFSWGRPQLDMIKEFCLNRFGWSSRRTEETLQPVIKQLNTQQTQLRIDSFFRMEQQEKQAIRSQRLRRAVTCMKRKERDGGEEEEEDSEEETPSPSKSKKGRTPSESPVKGRERGEERMPAAGAGGGFLGSESFVEPPVMSQRESSSSQESISVKASQCSKTSLQRSSSSQESISVRSSQSSKTPLQRSKRSSSSSEDSDDGGDKVTMVTARSVFKSSRGGKNSRGRGSARGKGRGRKTGGKN